MNPEQLRQTAAAMDAHKEGRPVEYFSFSSGRFLPDSNPYWSSFPALGYFRPAPIEFPPAPDGEEYHNPDNLTAEQVEVWKGWRLLTKRERRDRDHNRPLLLPEDCESWDTGSKEWLSQYNGTESLLTYRTQTPFVAKPKLVLGRELPGFRPLAENERWHRDDFTEDMLPEGWRPLLDGEKSAPDDQFKCNATGQFERTNDYWTANKNLTHRRTRRPLPELSRDWSGPDDVPIPFPYVKVGNVIDRITSVNASKVYGCQYSFTYEELRKGKWTQDGKTWLPCKTEVANRA